MVKLHIRVKQLGDGTFKVYYWWFLGWNVRARHFETEAGVVAFITELVTKTRWHVFENVPNSVSN
jgi:hypothetical protein